jgi:hypothetical protein
MFDFCEQRMVSEDEQSRPSYCSEAQTWRMWDESSTLRKRSMFTNVNKWRWSGKCPIVRERELQLRVATSRQSQITGSQMLNGRDRSFSM